MDATDSGRNTYVRTLLLFIPIKAAKICTKARYWQTKHYIYYIDGQISREGTLHDKLYDMQENSIDKHLRKSYVVVG